MKKILFFLLISTAALSQPYNGAPKLNTTPQGDESAMLVRQVPQSIYRIGFTKEISGSVDSYWGAIVGSVGSGMAVNQSGGNLLISTGTNPRSETIIRSTQSWIGGIRLRARSTISQRIVDNNFFVELVDVIGDNLTITNTGVTTTHTATWTRSTTTATITVPNHGLVLGSAFNVTVSSDGAAITTGAKTVLAVTNNSTFTLTCLDAGATSGTLTYTTTFGVTVTIPDNPFTSQNINQAMYMGAINLSGGVSPVILSQRVTINNVSGNDVTFVSQGQSGTFGTGTCSLFGHNYYQLQYTGTSATSVNFDTQRNGYATTPTAAAISSTASPGHLAIVTGNDLVATFADQLVATGATIKQTVRATRDENIPDDKNLRMQIRVVNGSTAPASTTTWTIGLIAVSTYANTDVVLQDVKPMGVGAGLPVEVLRSVATSSTITSGQTAHSTASTGSPLRSGGRVVPTTIATVDQTLIAGDAADVPNTTSNQLIVKQFGTAELDYTFNFQSVASTTTVQQLVPASGTAGVRNYITTLTWTTDNLGSGGVAWILDGALTVSSIAITTGLVTTSVAHDLKIGDAVVFTALAAGTGVSTNTIYYVTSVGSTTTFNFSLSIGGTNIVPTVAYTGTTCYRILYQQHFRSSGIDRPMNVQFTNPQRGRGNERLNFLIPTSMTSGTIYLTTNGFRLN